jgi:creatinine amidohydrolase
MNEELVPLYKVYGPKTLYEMTYEEVEELRKKTDIALIPVGSIEGHGPHLPLGVDAIQGDEICKRVARKLKREGIEVLLLPPIFWGVSHAHMKFPGTITVKSDTLKNLLKDICYSLIQHGFTKILMVAAHGGDEATCKIASQEMCQETEAKVESASQMTFGYTNLDKILKSERPYVGAEGHAGEKETSQMLAVVPELVKKDKMFKYFSEKTEEIWKNKKGFSFNKSFDEVTPVGFMGDPTVAEAETGHKIYNNICEPLIAYIKREFVARK